MKIYQRFGKRLFDVVCSLVGIMMVSPLFLVVPVLIMLDSPGTVFFRQKRTGLNGTEFNLLKFRSMAPDKDREGRGFEPGSSMRVTRIGKVLRKTKIDEIPQLWNVLAGDMSFVGPRPEVERYRSFYSGAFAQVLSVRPGITDSASIKYRHEEDILKSSQDPEKMYREVVLPDKLRIALTYVQSGISFSHDMRVIFQTLASVVKRSQ